jgi:hypothetical protein
MRNTSFKDFKYIFAYITKYYPDDVSKFLLTLYSGEILGKGDADLNYDNYFYSYGVPGFDVSLTGRKKTKKKKKKTNKKRWM